MDEREAVLEVGVRRERQLASVSADAARGGGMMRAFIAFIALASFPSSGSAQIVTVPSDLAPGAGYRLIFVTSAVRNGASANVGDYNAFVSAVASSVPALASLGTSWTAVAETATVSAPDNTGTNPMLVGGIPTNPGVPFYRLDGARVAHDNAYFWGMLFPLATISLTELGTAAPITVRSPDGSTQPWVWTGVGTGPSKLGTATPVVAWAYGGGANAWYGIAISGSANNHPLYAVSGVLHVTQAAPALPHGVGIALVIALAVLVAFSPVFRRAGSGSRRDPPG